MEKNKIKKLLITLLCIPMLVFGQKTYVPDDVFEAWLEGNGYGDGIAFNDSIITASVSFIGQLQIENKGISDLTGIEDFTSLYYLYAGGNQLTTIDLSSNYNLEYIYLQENPSLTQVQLPDSINSVWWNNNNEPIKMMWTINISNCNLSSINIPSTYQTYELYLNNNPLQSLDVSSFIQLREIGVSESNIISLDLSNNVHLYNVGIYDNDLLTELDLRNGNIINITNANLFNPNLSCISVNNLTIANNVLAGEVNNWTTFSLNCSGNGCTDSTALNYDSTATNDDGSCTYCIYGCMDPIASNYDSLATCDDGSCSSPTVYGCTNSNATNYNANATFDDGSCSYIKTYVPDDVFEAWLEGNGYGDGIAFNDSVATASISSLNNLDLKNKGIADLTGIEDCTYLSYLRCNGNNLTSLDLRFNYHLQNPKLGSPFRTSKRKLEY